MHVHMQTHCRAQLVQCFPQTGAGALTRAHTQNTQRRVHILCESAHAHTHTDMNTHTHTLQGAHALVLVLGVHGLDEQRPLWVVTGSNGLVPVSMQRACEWVACWHMLRGRVGRLVGAWKLHGD